MYSIYFIIAGRMAEIRCEHIPAAREMWDELSKYFDPASTRP